MAIYSLFSATGSPGVTTTAVALATRWPRNVLLVDADASGCQSIAAGFLRSNLPHGQGLMELAAASRHNQMRAVLHGARIHIEETNADFLQGPRSPLQARSLTALWPALVDLFASLDEDGTDVIVDLGRIGTEHFALPVLLKSDRAVMVMRSSLPAIVGANWRALELTPHFAIAEHGRFLKLAVVGQGQPYSAQEIGKKFGIAHPIPVGFDGATAAHFSVGSALPKRRIGTSTLIRSVDAMINTLREANPSSEEDSDD